MGIGSFFRKKEIEWDYEFRLLSKDTYSIVIDIDTPIRWWEFLLKMLEKRDVPILEEFSIEERFKSSVCPKLKSQIEKIVKEVKKDFIEFSILNTRCDEMKFRKTSQENIHCKIFISGLCHARR